MRITKLFGKKQSKLDKEIDDVIALMSTLAPNCDKYTAIVNNLEKLYKMKEAEKNHFIKPDTVALIANNLLSIALIMNFEELNIIRTKAFGFIPRGRV